MCIYHRWRQVPLSTFTHFESRHRAARDQSPGTISGGDHLVQSCPRRSARRCHESHRSASQEELNMPLSVQARFQGTAAGLSGIVANEPLLILAAIITVYIVLGVLTRAIFIRSQFFPRCPRPASARFWRC